MPRLRRGAASAVGRDHRSVFCRAKGDAWRSALYTGMWEASMEVRILVPGVASGARRAGRPSPSAFIVCRRRIFWWRRP